MPSTLIHWQKLGGVQHYHGVVTPLLALRTQYSLGCGDFDALYPLIDWIARSGFHLIQLLPLNDTGYDPSPYAPLSPFTLNPIYISLPKEQLTESQRCQLEQLEAAPRVSYGQLRGTKLKILRQLVASGWGKGLWANYQGSGNWADRIEQYAQFMALKDFYGLKPWWQWPDRSQLPLAELKPEIELYATLQVIAHEQLLQVSRYGALKGIRLVGDLPILQCRDSSEVCFDHDLFNLELEAGAPADSLAPEGQKWGFPTYRWQKFDNGTTSWWQDRLAWAENYFDLYRIDHVAGFFGFWSIAAGKKASEGFYEPPEADRRLELGRVRLKKLLEASNRLPIGEDLGQIDPRIHETLKALGIPGICVMRWQREWGAEASFIHPSDYPKLSVACVSTHDSSTLRQWFAEEPQAALALSEKLGISPVSQWSCEWSQQILQASHQASSALHLNLLVDYLDAFDAFKAPSAELYRINVPGSIQATNWTMRYPITIEQLAEFAPLQLFWRSLCHESRSP